MGDETRTCKTCNLTQPMAAFIVMVHGKPRSEYKCRECRRLYSAAYYAKNGEQMRAKIRAQSKAFRVSNPEEARRRVAASRAKRKAEFPEEYARAAYRVNIKKRYGLTIEQYDAMVSTQGGRCAICGVTQNCSKRFFAVDHNHETGRVRELLCDNCNCTIGYAKEDVVRLRAAADYLERHAKESS